MRTELQDERIDRAIKWMDSIPKLQREPELLMKKFIELSNLKPQIEELEVFIEQSLPILMNLHISEALQTVLG